MKLEREARRAARSWLSAVPALLEDADEAIAVAQQRGDADAMNLWLNRRSEWQQLTALARQRLADPVEGVDSLEKPI